MKDSLTTLRFDDRDREALRAVAESLGIDMSNTIRFLIHEKHRELGKGSPPPATRSKKRRARAA